MDIFLETPCTIFAVSYLEVKVGVALNSNNQSLLQRN